MTAAPAPLSAPDNEALSAEQARPAQGLVFTRLRVTGFKSFLGPIDVPIRDGLTGVVGPNGCGKSNLLEALRWVMGASSAKALRGGAMDDVIFAGSADRPARNHAEVALWLDNAARTAPEPFNDADELIVTRRIVRGGGSTYRVNGRDCRAKDVQLLFADASSGANSAALVRQGQISELIAAKPENRRKILEDAAGVSGLRARRHDGELRLRAAQANLERLHERAGDAQRQLESLRRQAREARRYRELSREIAALETALHARRVADAQAAVSAAQTERLATSERASAARTAREEAQGAQAQAETTQARAQEAADIAAGVDAQAQVALQAAQSALTRAEEAASAKAARLAELNSDLSEAQTGLAEARAAREAAPDVAALVAEANALEDPAEDTALAHALRTAEASRESAQAARDEAMRARAAAGSEAEAATTALAQAERACEKAQAALTNAERASAAAPALSPAPEPMAPVQDAAKAAEDRVGPAKTRREDAAAALREAQARYDAAKAAREGLAAEAAGLARLDRPDEAAAPNPAIDGVRATPGYEAALAAALSVDAQASLDTSEPTAWTGAATPSADLPEGVEALADLVVAPDALAARLSQTGVVEDAQTAERLASALAPGQRLVTREGGLWRWDGLRRAPGGAESAAAAKLETRARREAVDADLARADAALGEAEAALSAARQADSDADAALGQIRSAWEAAAKRLAALEAEHAGHARAQAAEAAAASARADALAGRREAVETAQAALAEARARADAAPDPSALVEAERAAEAALNEARRAVATARESQDSRLRAKASARRAAQEAAVAVERAEARVAAAHERAQRLDARLAEAEADAAGPVDLTPLLEALAGADAARQAADADRARARQTLEAALADTKLRAEALTQAVEGDAQAREARARAESAYEAAVEQKDRAERHAREALGRLPDAPDHAKDARDEATLDSALAQAKAKRERMGAVNLAADDDLKAREAEMDDLAGEREDLEQAVAALGRAVQRLNAEARARLREAFAVVNAHFQDLFATLFQGGRASLAFTGDEDPLEAGLDISVQPPGKRLGALSLLSGGEQALTATALIFAVFLTRPSPLCALDEVDAPLDDANVERFCRLLRAMRARADTRFLVITHHPTTMARMDRLVGVTMAEPGVSQLVAVDLGAAHAMVAGDA